MARIEFKATHSKIEAAFSYTDFSSGSVAIGSIPANSRVVAAVAIVDDIAFDNGSLTIGDSIAQGRLMTVAENNLLIPDVSYRSEKDILYSSSTNVNIYLSGNPSMGSGTVVIYFSR